MDYDQLLTMLLEQQLINEANALDYSIEANNMDSAISAFKEAIYENETLMNIYLNIMDDIIYDYGRDLTEDITYD